MINLLVYGTLRKGIGVNNATINNKNNLFYNYERFGPQKHIKTFYLNGFDMYNLGGYPCVIQGMGRITVEQHQVEDDIFKSIENMEICAGYKTEIIAGCKLFIYKDTKEVKKYCSLITSGDWSLK